MDNVMEQQKREQFISGYIKRQEEMLLENLRARIEAEVNSSIRSAGLEQLEKDNTRFSLQINDDKKVIGELTEKNDNLLRVCNEYLQKIKSLEDDNVILKKNYDLVNNAYNELQATAKQREEEFAFKYSDVVTKKIAIELEHEKLIASHKENIEILEKAKKKQSPKKAKDWEDETIIN